MLQQDVMIVCQKVSSAFTSGGETRPEGAGRDFDVTGKAFRPHAPHSPLLAASGTLVQPTFQTYMKFSFQSLCSLERCHVYAIRHETHTPDPLIASTTIVKS